jgi:hypothetical protein
MCKIVHSSGRVEFCDNALTPLPLAKIWIELQAIYTLLKTNKHTYQTKFQDLLAKLHKAPRSHGQVKGVVDCVASVEMV